MIHAGRRGARNPEWAIVTTTVSRLLLGLLVVLSVGSALSPAQTTPPLRSSPWCADTTGIAARFMRAKLEMIVSGSDPLFAQGRDSLGSLPHVPASSVHFVTNESVCERASRMLDTAFFAQPRQASIHVMQAGDRYVLHPPLTTTGGVSFAVVTDTAFGILARTRW